MAKSHTQYGEPKKQKQFMLTDTASAILDKHSEACGISRSDLLEQLLRTVDEYGTALVKGFVDGDVDLQYKDGE